MEAHRSLQGIFSQWEASKPRLSLSDFDWMAREKVPSSRAAELLEHRRWAPAAGTPSRGSEGGKVFQLINGTLDSVDITTDRLATWLM